MHGWGITCGKCGDTNDTERWIETPAGQKRPKEHYQCPTCKVAFVRKSGPPTVGEWGANGETVLIPGDVVLEFIPSVDWYDNDTVKLKGKRL